MKKSHKFFLLFLLTACAAGGHVVTMDKFYEVPIGATEPQLVESIGKPYAIKEKKDGSKEYEYIERIKIGNRDAEERKYIIVIQNGKVASKKIESSIPLPYGFDSYDMQTTQNENVVEE
jgi:hypothetical protein